MRLKKIPSPLLFRFGNLRLPSPVLFFFCDGFFPPVTCPRDIPFRACSFFYDPFLFHLVLTPSFKMISPTLFFTPKQSPCFLPKLSTLFLVIVLLFFSGFRIPFLGQRLQLHVASNVVWSPPPTPKPPVTPSNTCSWV